MDIDNKISELFQNLLASGTTFIEKIDYDKHCIVYNLSNTLVTLKIANYFKGKEPWDNKYSSIENVLERKAPYDSFWYSAYLNPEDKYSSVFELTVKGKHYFVPKLSRVEKAKAIESIEESIQNYENATLDAVASAVL